MKHSFGNAAHRPILYTTIPMCRHGDEIKLLLLCFLHNGFSHVRVGLNRGCNGEIKECQIASTEIIRQGCKVHFILVLNLLFYSSVNVSIALKFSTGSRKINYSQQMQRTLL